MATYGKITAGDRKSTCTNGELGGPYKVCHSEPLAAAQRAERASEESAFLLVVREQQIPLGYAVRNDKS